MTRHDMKQDELVTAIEKASQYVTKNPAQIRNWAIAVGAALVLVIAVVAVLKSRASGAADLLRQGQARYAGQVVPGGSARPNDPVPTYSSEQERDRAALETFDKLVQ